MHPTEAELIRYLENTLSKEKRKRLEAHMSDCATCTEQLAAIGRLPEVFADSTAPTISRATLGKASKRISTSRPISRYAIAATIIFAVGVGALMLLRNESELSSFRGSTATPNLVLFPEDGSTISPTTVLRWSAIAPALAYEVSLLKEDGSRIWNVTIKDTSCVVPASVALEPGKRYLWRVEAFFPDDTRLRSNLRTFTFSP